MSLIFDLKESEPSWSAAVNEALEADWPEYIESNGTVGSHQWWQKYESGTVPHKENSGVVTFVGERVDQFNEQYESVEIDINGTLVEFDRIGYWANEEISVGAKVVVETFEICVQQKYGPTTFIFERLVAAIKT
ncbi:hypothetical protein [Marinibactrum halimedae]|uniref:Uncharacterized protein n=1 Tax=Marinibactrum halimedae TaxID=1444977 RepID=A0AA37T996_9GAMM|nr:hypothetical protein [Marinibactrum halimedae]MCD9460592.1 hypothetical protein [Marinibactrum halimedae]GLS27223.1 hypothetical protein GCM10007877_29420 [Marinibactrum halimedae]